MPATDIAIREAGPEDSATLAAMVAELARWEGKAAPPASAAQLRDWLAADTPPFRVLLALRDGEALGYLAFYQAFSLFKPGPVLLVENIYVRPEARGAGVGRGLLARAAVEARRRGWTRMELNVSQHNTQADAMYAAVGFSAPGEAVRRIEGDALARLAGAAP